MPVPDVFWSTEHGHFNYRVAGVCVERQHVFLQQEVGTDFWFVPGGRCQLMERAADTLGREMREELDTAVRVGRLLWIVENFFALGGRACHEIGLYFHMSLPASSDVGDHDRTFIRPAREHESPCRYQWFPVGELDRIRLYPAALRDVLHRLPRTPRHLIQQG
ncbi:MAG: NUDIX domain-containing protein [Chloroflexia bacterium]|nr:NUDIX domain-containing protein [Chloroflexia bacterium]